MKRKQARLAALGLGMLIVGWASVRECHLSTPWREGYR
jgi:hypothetical protein